FGVKAKPGANPAKRLLHHAIFVRPQIKYVDLGLGLWVRYYGHDGVNTVGDIGIRFALLTIPKHGYLLRVSLELPDKIQDMAVLIVFAQNTGEPHDIALHPKTFAISLNQSFTRQLRRTVKRSLHRERGSFGRRKDFG